MSHDSPRVSHDSPRAREAVRRLRGNQIRDIANAAMGMPDVLPLWFGESDMVTPPAIRNAGIAALEAGETFYSPNLGIPTLRGDIAAYVSRLHGRVDGGRVAVTSSGVSALMLTLQSLVAPRDRVLVVTPVWPNLVEMPRILGAEVTCVPLRFGPRGWALDLDRLLQSLVPGTKAVLINSPNNPTGWSISGDEQEALLRRCREIGAWIVADDVYERLFFRGPCAPSFLDIAAESDRVVSCNSFSKAWRMTGWRIGWAVLPGEVPADFEKLIEFNTSCVPQFVQRAASTALRDGEGDVAFLVDRIAANQLNARRLLADIPEVELGAPASGAMYLFMRVRGLQDSLEFCRQLVAHGRLGLAPGSAFGDEASGFLRWCLAVDGDRLEEGVRRFRRFIKESWPSLRPK